MEKYVFKVETKHVEKSKQHPKGLYDVLFDSEFVFRWSLKEYNMYYDANIFSTKSFLQ